jgi:hypothetical protein
LEQADFQWNQNNCRRRFRKALSRKPAGNGPPGNAARQGLSRWNQMVCGVAFREFCATGGKAGSAISRL